MAYFSHLLGSFNLLTYFAATTASFFSCSSKSHHKKKRYLYREIIRTIFVKCFGFMVLSQMWFYSEPARSGFSSCTLISSPKILLASCFCRASCASSAARSRLAMVVGGSAGRMLDQESKTRMRFNSGLAHPFTMQKFTSNSSWCLLCSCFRCDDSHRVPISILGIEIQKRKLWNGFGFAP